MKLSDQALGAVMMALQKSLLEQSIQGDSQDELVVTNPPTFKVGEEQPEFVHE